MIKSDVQKDPKVLRLREIYEESGHKSVNSFCKAHSLNQPTVSNYMCGFRVPTIAFFDKIAESFPQYNKEWILYGVGEKYNPKYVQVRGDGNYTQSINGNNNNGNTIHCDSGLVDKITDLATKLANMADRFAATYDRCSELEKQLEQANKMIAELKSKKE